MEKLTNYLTGVIDKKYKDIYVAATDICNEYDMKDMIISDTADIILNNDKLNKSEKDSFNKLLNQYAEREKTLFKLAFSLGIIHSESIKSNFIKYASNNGYLDKNEGLTIENVLWDIIECVKPVKERGNNKK